MQQPICCAFPIVSNAQENTLILRGVGNTVIQSKVWQHCDPVHGVATLLYNAWGGNTTIQCTGQK